jgi:hypothetical protein
MCCQGELGGINTKNTRPRIKRSDDDGINLPGSLRVVTSITARKEPKCTGDLILKIIPILNIHTPKFLLDIICLCALTENQMWFPLSQV